MFYEKDRINLKSIEEITLYTRCVEWYNFERIKIFELKYLNRTIILSWYLWQGGFAFCEEIEEGNNGTEFNYV